MLDQLLYLYHLITQRIENRYNQIKLNIKNRQVGISAIVYNY